MNKLISWFQLNYPHFVKEMKNVSHHFDEQNLNPYHLEGDVWTHTTLVCNDARRISKSVNVYIAALLHDIGKAFCFEIDEEKKRKHFQQHENVSTFYAVDILEKLANDEDMKEYNFDTLTVLKLINWHTDFHTIGSVVDGKFILSDKHFNKLNKKYGNDKEFFLEMIDLNQADNSGRFYTHEDIQNIDEKFDILRSLVHKFKENDISKDHLAKCIILTGIPTCGKSTFIKNNFNLNETVILSIDELIINKYPDLTYNEAYKKVMEKKERVEKDEKGEEVTKIYTDFDDIEKEFSELIFSNSKKELNLIIDKTNLTKKSRNKVIAKIPSSKYKIVNICFLIGEQMINKRNKKRDIEDNKYMSKRTFDLMIKNFNLPSLEEVDSISYIFSKDLNNEFENKIKNKDKDKKFIIEKDITL